MTASTAQRSRISSLIAMEDDKYEEYNYDDAYHAESSARKGKSKKEAHKDAKAQSSSGRKPGQERKLAEQIANAENKRKEDQSSSKHTAKN